MKNHLSDPMHDPLIDALMSLVIPGLGQLVKGSTISGILWAIIVGFSYLAMLPLGIMAHILCISDAAFNKQGLNFKHKSWLGRGLILLVVFSLIFYVSYRSSAF